MCPHPMHACRQYNNNCEPAKLISTFASKDPGTEHAGRGDFRCIWTAHEHLVQYW